jgi:hypothetical protein
MPRELSTAFARFISASIARAATISVGEPWSLDHARRHDAGGAFMKAQELT